jgi:hypothetical protein
MSVNSELILCTVWMIKNLDWILRIGKGISLICMWQCLSCLLQTETCRTELSGSVSVSVRSVYSFIEHTYVNISQLKVNAPDYESPLHRCTSPCSMTRKNRDLGDIPSQIIDSSVSCIEIVLDLRSIHWPGCWLMLNWGSVKVSVVSGKPEIVAGELFVLWR